MYETNPDDEILTERNNDDDRHTEVIVIMDQIDTNKHQTHVK